MTHEIRLCAGITGGKSESVEARQLTKAGCKKAFRDVHVSSAETNRARLRRVIETLEPRDVLMVTRLDWPPKLTPHQQRRPSNAPMPATKALLISAAATMSARRRFRD